MTKKDIVKKHLREHGEISNHYCIDTRLTTRLGAIIHLLRKTDGMDIETRFDKGTKDTTYVLVNRPVKLVPQFVEVDGQRMVRMVPDESNYERI